MVYFPTILTLSRFFFAIFVSTLLFFDSTTSVILAVVLFVLGSLSDALDGAFARRKSLESKFGEFLDPIADKFLVFLVLISLIYHREWMASFSKNNLVKVSSLGKTKTITQMTGIGMIIASPIINYSYYFEISILVLTIGTFFAYFSAYKYFKQSLSYIR